jgi:hypothetical protein
MNEQLHPLTLGEILDRTAQIYRTGFLRFAGVAAIPMGVLLAFAAVVVGSIAYASHAGAKEAFSYTEGVLFLVYMGAVGLVGVPLFMGALALSWAALTDATAKMFLGETFTILGAYGSLRRRRWRVLWLLTMAILFVGAIPGSGMFALAFGNAALAALADKAGLRGLGVLSSVVTFALLAALAFAALWILLLVCMAFAACVVEDKSAWQALKRSATLSTGTKGRLFVVFLLGYAVETVLSLGFYVPALVVLALVPGLQGEKNADASATATMIVVCGLMLVVKALTTPVYGIALTLVYFDQRIRKEGFDIEWLMRDAGMELPAGAAEEPAAQGAAPWVVVPEERSGADGGFAGTPMPPSGGSA